MIFDKRLAGFLKTELDAADLAQFHAASKKLRYDALLLVEAAGSGHIGGSFSTIDSLFMAYLCAHIKPENYFTHEHDQIVVSHGHISPALYSILINLHYMPREAVYKNYRKVSGLYEGHPNRLARGVDWGSGSLGQGLSVGCGMALAARMQGAGTHTFVFMGDGEQNKGQLFEAMQLARKYKLGSLTAVVDWNHQQSSGTTEEILPQNLKAVYEAAGWRVFAVNGHDYAQLYAAMREAYGSQDIPCVILANTVMGKGLPFIENDWRYHGAQLTQEQFDAAKLLLSGTEDAVIQIEKPFAAKERACVSVSPTMPFIYGCAKPLACRTAVGDALCSIAAQTEPAGRPVVIDCDVAPSTGTAGYAKAYPERFIQCGIAEHNAASVAGGVAISGLPTFFADFGVFSIDEPYGQLRMNSTNHVPVKIIASHCGLDVGQDGKTHHCIDYIALANNLIGFELIVPADVNQADRVTRYLARSPEAGIIAFGRSPQPVLADESGAPLFGEGYTFIYGKADWLLRGKDAAIVTCGSMAGKALEAAALLRNQGVCCGVLNVSCPKALDREALMEAAKTGTVVTYEDHLVQSGLGSLVAAFYQENGVMCKFRRMGVTQYGGSASPGHLYALQRLDAASAAETVVALYHKDYKERIV